MKKFRSAATVAAIAATGALTFASDAHAIAVTLADDAGNPVPWAGDRGAQTNMNPELKFTYAPNEKGSFTASVKAPDGVEAIGIPFRCGIASRTSSLDFRGNGAYTLTLNKYASDDCTGAATTTTAVVTNTAAMTLTGPAGPVLMRLPNQVITTPIALPVSPKPVGAVGYEIRYAPNATVDATGGFTVPSTETVRDDATGAVQFRPPAPGFYTFIARGKGFNTASGQFFTPWTPPVVVHAIAPFDISRPLALDSRGPRYKLRFQIGERTASGRVSIAIARGSKGGKYKSYGSVKISTKATFTKSFTLRRSGTYRMRLKYKGNATTAGGTIVHKFKISRRYL